MIFYFFYHRLNYIHNYLYHNYPLFFLLYLDILLYCYFVDVVLGLMYIACVAVAACVIWSVYRRNRRGAGRQSVQNGIKVRLLNISVWSALIVFALLSFLLGDGSAVDAIVITLFLTLAVSLVVTGWSFIRRK